MGIEDNINSEESKISKTSSHRDARTGAVDNRGEQIKGNERRNRSKYKANKLLMGF